MCISIVSFVPAHADRGLIGLARGVGSGGYFCWKPAHHRSGLSIGRDLGRGGGHGHHLECSGMQRYRGRVCDSGV